MAIAFSGNRGSTAGIYLRLRFSGVLIAVAGGELADGFGSFPSEQRVGVRVVHLAGYDQISVVFAATLGGMQGIWVRDVVVAGATPPRVLAPQRLVKVGDTLAGSTVTAFTLYRPFHEGEKIAFSARLADGGTAIVTATSLSMVLRDEQDTANFPPLLEPSILRVSLQAPLSSIPGDPDSAKEAADQPPGASRPNAPAMGEGGPRSIPRATITPSRT